MKIAEKRLPSPETITEGVNRAIRFPHVFIDDVTTYSRVRYLIKGVIDERTIGVVYGPSGCGKTFFMIDLAGHIACGMSYHNRRVHGGLVIYVASEAGESIQFRLAAWHKSYIKDSRKRRIPLAVMTRGPNLLNGPDVDAFMTELRAIEREANEPLRLVVIDTLSRSIPSGDENGPKDMTLTIAVADRIRDELKAATIFVHHSGKDRSKGPRGHTSLYSSADTSIVIANNVATLEKSRDGTPNVQFGFHLEVVDLGTDEDGDPITTCVVRPAGVTAAKRPMALPRSARVALQALREAIQNHGELLPGSSTISNGITGVTIDRWRSQFCIQYGSGDKKSATVRKAFQRGCKVLSKANVIGLSDPYVWEAQ